MRRDVVCVRIELNSPSQNVWVDRLGRMLKWFLIEFIDCLLFWFQNLAAHFCYLFSLRGENLALKSDNSSASFSYLRKTSLSARDKSGQKKISALLIRISDLRSRSSWWCAIVCVCINCVCINCVCNAHCASALIVNCFFFFQFFVVLLIDSYFLCRYII